MLDGMSPNPGLSNELQNNAGFEKFKKACSEFESIFITQLLKSRGENIAGKGGLLNNNEGRIIKSMFDENLGKSIAESGGIGLSDILVEHIKL